MIATIGTQRGEGDEPHNGGCVCGAVRFEAPSRPLWAAYCHCTGCRAATGAPMTLWVGFRAAHVRWTGKQTIRPGDGAVERGFCGDCGAPLSYADATIPGGEIYLAIGAFDEPARIEPVAHAFWRSRLPFVVMDDGLPSTRRSRAREAAPMR